MSDVQLTLSYDASNGWTFTTNDSGQILAGWQRNVLGELLDRLAVELDLELGAPEHGTEVGR